MTQVNQSLVDLKALQLDLAFERGVNLAERIITISGDIDENTFRIVDTALTELKADGKGAVTIRINSQGGLFYDALAIVGRMKASKLQITTEAYGSVMSAAVAVLAAGKKRKMSSVAWFMHHESSYDMGSMSHSQHKELVEQREREEHQWSEFLAQHSYPEASEWYEKAQKTDWYLTAQQCLELGVIDEII